MAREETTPREENSSDLENYVLVLGAQSRPWIWTSANSGLKQRCFATWLFSPNLTWQKKFLHIHLRKMLWQLRMLMIAKTLTLLRLPCFLLCLLQNRETISLVEFIVVFLFTSIFSIDSVTCNCSYLQIFSSLGLPASVASREECPRMSGCNGAEIIAQDSQKSWITTKRNKSATGTVKRL